MPPSHPWPYPRWIAHRGAGKLAPENTLAAFRLGAQHGYRMFECDVKLSADGVPFLLHDATLERTTSGQGVAGEKTWSELAGLDAGAWLAPHWTGEPLLRLDTLARWLQANGLMVNLEIKPSPGEGARTGAAVAHAVAELWRDAPVWPLLSSFDLTALSAARDARPALPRALLLERWRDDAVDLALSMGAVALVPHCLQWTAERVERTHAAGLRALTYTVNEEDLATRLGPWGLDGLITDRVDLFQPDSADSSRA